MSKNTVVKPVNLSWIPRIHVKVENLLTNKHRSTPPLPPTHTIKYFSKNIKKLGVKILS